MSIAVTTTNYQAEDLSWKQASVYPPRTIELDISAFTANTHYPNGYIPSGVPIAKITASGLYGPYANGGSGGLEVCSGLLAASVKVQGTSDLPAAMFEDGIVIASKMPIAIDSPGKVDLAGWFKFI